MKKTLIVSAALALSLSAGDIDVAVPFGGYIDYGSDGAKDSAYYGGLYVEGTNGVHKIKLQYSYLDIDYRFSDSIAQNDYTIAYENGSFKELLVGGGFHYIDSDDYLTDGGKILFLRLQKFSVYDFDTGLDIYYSKYSNFDPSLNVWQFSPSIGKFIKGCRYGNFYLNATYNYITFKSSRVTQTVVANSRMPVVSNRHTITVYEEYSSDNHSLELSATNYYGKFTTKGYVWFGKQAFAVRDGGFTVYNLNEVHKGGAGLSVNYDFSSNMGVGCSLTYEKFTDTETGGDTSMMVAGVSLNYMF